MNYWLVIVVIGIATYLLRLSFVGLLGSRPMPLWAERPLSYVAPSVLAALTVPAVMLRDSSLDLSPETNPRFLAAIVAGLVAWRFRNMAAVIIIGMSVLWILQGLV